MGHGLLNGPLSGVLIVALVTAGMVACFGSVLYQRELGAFLVRLARRLAPPPERPSGLPLERIASNVRRLRGELATLPWGTPVARRRGLSNAYDDLLLDACRALGVPDTLSGMAAGPERDSERLHVERELEDVGLRLSG